MGIAKQFEPLTEEKIKLHVIANVLRLVVEIYTPEDRKEKLKKIEGEEILLKFPYGSITVIPNNERLLVKVGEPENPSAFIEFKESDENDTDAIGTLLSGKSSIWGLLKLVFKYVIPGKIKLSWRSLGKLRILLGLLSLGDEPMWDGIERKK